jgi:chemotaxis protein methyltransferase CheR
LVDDFVPKLLAQGVRPRLWCAACSTGEEALTLAMLLDEAGLLDQVSIVASDISNRALAHAKAGVYRRRSLRALPLGVVGRWLEGDADGMRVAPHIAQAVQWHRVNLIEEREVAGLGRFDAIVCRNVLIYFQDRTIVKLVENLGQSLLPGGILMVGASESLLRFGVPFVCEEQRGAFLYRKLPE